jgi:hypothetical protein
MLCLIFYCYTVLETCYDPKGTLQIEVFLSIKITRIAVAARGVIYYCNMFITHATVVTSVNYDHNTSTVHATNAVMPSVVMMGVVAPFEVVRSEHSVFFKNAEN